MRISVKGRYGLASMMYMALKINSSEPVTVASISEKLGISKIYLEQVFSLLKRGGLVSSVKGAQGGYKLARTPQQITAYDVLSAAELALFESTEETVNQKSPETDAAMQALVFSPLGEYVKTALQRTTLYDLAHEAEKHKQEQGHMFYI